MAFMRSAQIKTFENVAVLVVFFFLLAMGAGFYLNYQKKIYSDEVAKLTDIKAFETIMQILYQPELQCPGVLKQFGCIDKIKFEVFKELLKEPLYTQLYYNVYGNSKISITPLFPDTQNSIDFYKNILTNYGEKRIIKIPVLFYDPLSEGTCQSLKGSCSFAILEVDFYAK